MLTFVYTFILVFFANKVNSGPINDTETWTGNWFPQNPLKATSEKDELQELFDTTKTETKTKESWDGKWFPYKPKAKITSNYVNEAVNPINVESSCDDGKTNINIDFDPENKVYNYNYICLSNRSHFDPSYATHPIQREYDVPPAFKAPSYCQNETIEYEDRLPTFGAHRYLFPQFGEYIYLPPQRWMHNLEYGAVVMLYHPCANGVQIQKLKAIVNACLYSHIITSSKLLLAERPLAVLVWGKSLEMSVVDIDTVVDFIKNNAKKGPASGAPDVQKYDAGLLLESKLVTDETDSELCANINKDQLNIHINS